MPRRGTGRGSAAQVPAHPRRTGPPASPVQPANERAPTPARSTVRTLRRDPRFLRAGAFHPANEPETAWASRKNVGWEGLDAQDHPQNPPEPPGMHPHPRGCRPGEGPFFLFLSAAGAWRWSWRRPLLLLPVGGGTAGELGLAAAPLFLLVLAA